jgi:hypothetical protein
MGVKMFIITVKDNIAHLGTNSTAKQSVPYFLVSNIE